MKKSLFNYSSYIFILLGFAFSLLNIFDTNSYFCVTTSCEVFSEFTFLGISLWIYSAAFFFLLFILACMKEWLIIFVFCAIGLVCDIVLLCLMLITAPCFSCLVIALILSLVTLTAYKARFENNFVFLLIAFWALLFVVNVGALVKNAVQPFVIYKNEALIENPLDATMRVYFSPSCTACSSLVELLGERETTNSNNIAWLPVAESSEDIAKVAQMLEYINEGDSLKLALEKTKANPKVASFTDILSNFYLQSLLLINQSRLNAAGTTKIPFIEYTGVPGFLNKKTVSADEEANVLSPSNSTNPTSSTSPLDALGDLTNKMQEQQNEKQTNKQSALDQILNLNVESYCDESRDSTEPCE